MITLLANPPHKPQVPPPNPSYLKILYLYCTWYVLRENVQDRKTAVIAAGQSIVSIGVLADPLDLLSRLDCSTTKRVPMPKRAVFERSRRELSLDVSVGVHILLAVERSSLESQSRGCAKTPVLTVASNTTKLQDIASNWTAEGAPGIFIRRLRRHPRVVAFLLSSFLRAGHRHDTNEASTAPIIRL